MRPRTFLKTFMLIMIALLIPLLLFFFVTISITQNQLRNTSESANYAYLQQVRFNTDLILNQIDQLSLSFDLNSEIGFQLDQCLQQNGSSYATTNARSIIQAFASSESISRPYIHSIYIYFDYSSERFFSFREGVKSVKSASDTVWIESYQNQNYDTNLWTEIRDIRPYSVGAPTSVVSIYRRTVSRPGVIVMNLLPQYIEDGFYADSTSDSTPYIVVLNEKGEIAFQNDLCPFKNPLDLSTLMENDDETFSIRLEDKLYNIYRLASDQYNWTYLAIVPQDSLYLLASRIKSTFGIVLLLCLLLGMLLAFLFTYRNYRQMKNIMQLFEAAEAEEPLPPIRSMYMQDEYTILTDNLIKTFIEQRYMRLAVSERLFHMKMLELQALQAQINPHFLVNTLKNIYWMSCSLTDGPNKVSEMIDALSGILYYSLRNPFVMVPLEEELLQTRNYLKIQTTRYPNKFTTDFQYDDDILQEKTLRMILQPIIENSIQHGFLPENRPGHLKICIRRVEDYLIFTISDNGAGMSRENLEKLRMRLYADTIPEQEIRHIGLLNTAKRLSLRYGSHAQIQIKSKAGVGTTITLNIPTEDSKLSLDSTLFSQENAE